MTFRYVKALIMSIDFWARVIQILNPPLSDPTSKISVPAPSLLMHFILLPTMAALKKKPVDKKDKLDPAASPASATTPASPNSSTVASPLLIQKTPATK